MPLKNYGILKGKAIEVRPGAGQNPHYQVYIVDDTTDYRIAINVQSKLSPSELEYLIDDRFDHPILALLEEIPRGFTKIASKPGTSALDYIRGNLFDRTQMRPLPFNLPGLDNDLNEKIDNVMLRVDGVMGKADSLMLGLNTIAGGAAGGELNLMVKSIRDLAEDFDKRSGALMADGRRTLGDISRAVNNFDRNPSRVIFGGSNNPPPPADSSAAVPRPAPAGPGPRAPGGQKRQ